MRICKLFFSIEKEEAWLSSMAKKGYLLRSTSFFYAFDKRPAEDAIYRIDCRHLEKKSDYLDYYALFEDSGWKLIGGGRFSRKLYFMKKEINSSDDIFSDPTSKAGRYHRLAKYWFRYAFLYFAVSVFFISNPNNKYILQPKSLYLTPGLWDMTGIQFVFAFLFETFFVFLRAYLGVLMLIMFLSFLLLGLKAYLSYRRRLKSASYT